MEASIGFMSLWQKEKKRAKRVNESEEREGIYMIGVQNADTVKNALRRGKKNSQLRQSINESTYEQISHR